LLAPVNIPLVHTLVNDIVQNEAEGRNLVAGTTTVLPVADKDAGKSFTLVTPAGEERPLGLPEVVRGRTVLPLNDLSQAGVYRVVGRREDSSDEESDRPATEKDKEKESGSPVAVRPDLRESADLTSLTDSELDGQLGFKPIHVIAGTDPGSYSGVVRANLEWTPEILMAVLALAVSEGILAWFCGKAW
jgi:hypothetical protein